MTVLREEVEQALINGVPEVEGRVYESHVPTSDTVRPCLYVREGIDAFTDWWIPNASQIEVVPVVDPNTFVDIDLIRREIRETLHGLVVVSTDVPAERYQLWFDSGVRADTPDTSLIALTRGERFTVINLTWLKPVGIVPDPAWSTATFVESRFPPGVIQIDVGSWMPVDTSPGVYFRVEQTTDTEKMNLVQWRTGTLVGHVITKSAVAGWEWSAHVRDKLSIESFICMDDGRKCYIQPGLQVNFSSNPWRQGQIRIPIRYGILRGDALLVPPLELIMTAQSSPTEGTVPQFVVSAPPTP